MNKKRLIFSAGLAVVLGLALAVLFVPAKTLSEFVHLCFAPHTVAALAFSLPMVGMAVAAGLVDVQQIPLYDRVIIAAATLTTNPIQFFTVPIGNGTGINGAKQLWDTNLTQASRLEAPRSFLVRALRFYIEPDTALPDLIALYKNYVLVLIVGEKVYQLAPAWFFPQGGGAYSGGNLTTARLASTNPEQFYANGLPDPGAINVIAENLAVKIEQGENFRVELQGNPFTTVAAAGTTFGVGLNMRAVLDGVLSRQVQ
jgi:hypothetical protein